VGFQHHIVENKNIGKIWVYIDFRNLNKATRKDEYPVPIAGILINNASGHRVIICLDGNVSYNQLFMVKEDMSKMALRCPDFIRMSCYDIWLKNADTTYQRAMNLIFYNCDTLCH
jgi:hypothetical protein